MDLGKGAQVKGMQAQVDQLLLFLFMIFWLVHKSLRVNWRIWDASKLKHMEQRSNQGRHLPPHTVIPSFDKNIQILLSSCINALKLFYFKS